MKKAVVAIVCIFAFASFNNQAKAQSEGFELGIRFGEFIGNNVGIDGALDLGKNRLRGGLGLGNANSTSLFWEWQFPVGNGFTFYPGLGGIASLGNDLLLGAGAEVGIEYDFAEPITVGLDYRPIIMLVNTSTGSSFVGDWGLSVRYRF